jgi:hypothetical protein
MILRIKLIEGDRPANCYYNRIGDPEWKSDYEKNKRLSFYGGIENVSLS